MAIANLGRIFRVAARNKTAATTSPNKNATKSTADCSVMQYLYSHRGPPADVRRHKKMAAAKKREHLSGLEQCQNSLCVPCAWPSGTRVPIRQMTSRVLQRMQPRS